MAERDPVRLLEGLLTACEAAAVPPVALGTMLRRLLGHLAGDDQGAGEVRPAPYTTAPLAPEDNSGVIIPDARASQQKPAHPRIIPARDPAPRTSKAQLTQSNGSAPDGPEPAPSGRLSPADWEELRQAVKAEMLRRGLDMRGLADAIGRSLVTTSNTVLKRSPASAPITTLLREFVVAAPVKAASPAPSGGAGGARNGTVPAKSPPDYVKALANQLRAKRRLLPVTSTTLAGTIGCTAEELDDALHARPVPPRAAERLAAWAVAPG